ncbi:MAG: hypothetical protein IPJ89_01140 [Candidatus Iainarchaeum archaeon]|uniref:Uncharacterized protein n=1 Tax=Candidatus Iainarchaeum sp. TaxID=3101447 RepID=A0A7T9DK70_9ARCH|nr:MAG: hypothetical protein IPJ89_01140 [Candidatus Diapherotrites archaeon]
MVSSEMIVSLGLFVVQLAVAVYLIRYSNQQLMTSVSGLRDKNLELMKLNARLTKTMISNENAIRKELDQLRGSVGSKSSTEQVVAVPAKKA